LKIFDGQGQLKATETFICPGAVGKSIENQQRLRLSLLLRRKSLHHPSPGYPLYPPALQRQFNIHHQLRKLWWN